MEIGVKEIELIVQQVIQNMDRGASPNPLKSSVGKGNLGVFELVDDAVAAAHAYKIGESPTVCNCRKLFDHSFFVIIVPPCASELNFPGTAHLRKAERKGGKRKVVLRVARIKNCLWKIPLQLHGIKELRCRSGYIQIIGNIVTRVRAQLLKGCSIGVAQRSNVQLHEYGRTNQRNKKTGAIPCFAKPDKPAFPL